MATYPEILNNQPYKEQKMLLILWEQMGVRERKKEEEGGRERGRGR